MLLIWSGRGQLVLLSIFCGVICAATVNVVAESLYGHGTLGLKLMWVGGMLLATVVAAGLNYWLTQRFVTQHVRTFIDEATGERLLVRDNSSLFFIPNWFWTWIIAVVGVLITLAMSRAAEL